MNNAAGVKEQIRRLLGEMQADVCGFAAADGMDDAPPGFRPRDLFAACRSLIVLGLAIPRGLLEVEPRLIYGHFNYASCPQVDEIAFRAAKLLEERYDCRCVPLPCDGPYEYWDAERMHGHGLISIKHAAVAAGLGTLGKNTLLLNRSYGNRLTLGVILTDLELPADPPSPPLCLPGCHKCLDACPVQAIADGSVIQKRCRANTYGSTARGFDTVDCNACRRACPQRFGVKA